MTFHNELSGADLQILDKNSLSSELLKNIYNFLFFDVPDYYSSNISASQFYGDRDSLKIGVYFLEHDGDPVALLIRQRTEFLSEWFKKNTSFNLPESETALLHLYFPKHYSFDFDISTAPADASFLANHDKKHLQDGLDLNKTLPEQTTPKKRLF